MTINALEPELIPLETQRTFTPLGIRFWDPVLDVPIDSGLAVSAVPRDGAALPVAAFRTRSGIYAFQGLPGMRAVEYPSGIDPAPLSPPSPITFVIVVEDTLGRYLRAAFSVDLPLPFRGVFPPAMAGSPPSAGGRAYLFSAPARPVPPGIAAVRADLRDAVDGSAAAYAVLQVQVNGSMGVGIADSRGSTLVLFPFPVIDRLRLGSPPGIGQGPVSDYTRTATVTGNYQPAALIFPLAGRTDLPRAWQATPSLKSVLDAQTPAAIWQTDGGPPAASMAADLRFGQELILTTGTASPPASSSLVISRGTSPP